MSFDGFGTLGSGILPQACQSVVVEIIGVENALFQTVVATIRLQFAEPVEPEGKGLPCFEGGFRIEQEGVSRKFLLPPVAPLLGLNPFNGCVGAQVDG